MDRASRDGPFEHHYAQINGLRQHIVTCGAGPAVLFCHGFPDEWRVWRHQMRAVAEAGFTAIAPDLRGFGETDAPRDPHAYTAVDVIGDCVGILDHFAIPTAVIVGHDWGAGASWAAPVLRPDRFSAVATLSVPYGRRAPKSLPDLLVEAGQHDAYMLYFSRPGPADEELDADPETFLHRLFYTLSGAYQGDPLARMRVAETGRLTDSLVAPPGPLTWFDDAEMTRYVENFRRRGFTSALNTYRSLHRGWELLAAWADLPLVVPALFIYGEKELVTRFPGRAQAIENFTQMVPRALAPVMVPGAGHWVQLEAPEAVNAPLVAFLESLQNPR